MKESRFNKIVQNKLTSSLYKKTETYCHAEKKKMDSKLNVFLMPKGHTNLMTDNLGIASTNSSFGCQSMAHYSSDDVQLLHLQNLHETSLMNME